MYLERQVFAGVDDLFRRTENTQSRITAMAKAVVDPEELRRFAQDLKRFNTELKNQMTILNGRFIGLGQTWRDQEQRKFALEFDQTLKTLNRFMESAEEQIPFLLRKAEKIEEYLS